MAKLHYRDLVVWQRAIDLVPSIYEVARQLPREELYALGDQMRRAAISIPANIAEGQARRHPKEFLQFLSIARGSLAELSTLVILAQQLGYVPDSKLGELETRLAHVARPLHGLIAQLSAFQPANNQEPGTNNPVRPRKPPKS